MGTTDGFSGTGYSRLFLMKQNCFALSGLTSLTITCCFIIQRQTLKKHVVNMPGSFRWKEVRTISVAFQRLVLVISHGFRKLSSNIELPLAGLFFPAPWDSVSFPCFFCTPVLSAVLKCLSHHFQDCTPTQENSEGQTFCSLQAFLPISWKIMFVWLIFLAICGLPTDTPCPVNC